MKISKIKPDDPRLTAYALGELDAAEHVAIEALLKDDPEAREAVAQIRALGGDLAAVLAKEPLPFVTPPPQVRQSPPNAREAYRPRRFWRMPFYLAGGLAAACVAVLFVLQERKVAEHDRRLAQVRSESNRKVLEEKARTDSLRRQQDREVIEVELGRTGEDVVHLPAAATGSLPASPRVAAARPEASTAAVPLSEPPVLVAADEGGAPSPDAEVIKLAPIEVTANSDYGYKASNSIAGSRLNTRLADVGAAISVEGVVQDAGAGGRAGQQAYAANTESYDKIVDNDYLGAVDHPLSTFSIDVDTASYANMRRHLNNGRRPPRDAVRIEEMVNYFPYDYQAPKDEKPFATTMEVAAAPWHPQHRLVRIGLKGREIPDADRPALNLVFLLDVSGSMNEPNKLPLVKESMRLLVEKLKPTDRVAIVVYAGSSGLALPSTTVENKREILAAIDELRPGGSTNGAMGIHLAYDIAKANFIKEGANRVVLCTDGDFNVGVTSQGDLVRLVEDKARSGVFLTALGFGMGNYKDSTLEKLADKGNGNYGYVDNPAEARKLLADQLSGTLVTIAKDVKIQVEFNPARVKAYRLIGYENRMLKKEDFNNDRIDAGEIGAGHTVTALYEVVPVDVDSPVAMPTVDALKYRAPVETGVAAKGRDSAELLTLKLRYKTPAGDVSNKLEFPLIDRGAAFADASPDFKFAAAVAGFGMVLRESPHKGTASFEAVLGWAESGMDRDAGGYRVEFLSLVRKARDIRG